MPRTPVSHPYKWLAQYYDQIFSAHRSPIDAARQHVLGPILPRTAIACDLACGTGITALSFAALGIKVFAVDFSPVMCRLARVKARRAHLPLGVFRADMRRFRIPEPVGLVTCEADALNHVPHKADLRLVAKAVASALLPGGYFYFDVNNRRGFERYWTLSQWIEAPGVAVTMHGGHDRGSDRAWTEIEWFLRDGDCWRRRHERVEEVCWSSEEIRLTLYEAGFDRLRTWDAAPFFGKDSVVRPGCRTVWLARKVTGYPADA
jgi:SAM-dependent methyltransferase